MRWFEPCRFCGEGRPVAMRDPAVGYLRLKCVNCAVRCSNGGDPDADGFAGVFEVGEAPEPEPPGSRTAGSARPVHGP